MGQTEPLSIVKAVSIPSVVAKLVIKYCERYRHQQSVNFQGNPSGAFSGYWGYILNLRATRGVTLDPFAVGMWTSLGSDAVAI